MRTILYNAKVYIEKDHYAQAVLVEDGYIKQVGSNYDIWPFARDSTELYDCEGKTLIPGLNDSHMHFMLLGEARNQAKIDGAASIEEIIDICREFIIEHPDKVKNGLHASGWNQDYFTGEKRSPDRFDLDKISTDIPIILERVCGHILSTNTKTLEMLGLSGNPPQYPGGDFLIGKDGYPSGIFRGNACAFAKQVIPDFSEDERREILIDTMKYAVSCGVTSVQSNDIGAMRMDKPSAFRLFRDLYDSGKALLRYRHQVNFDSLQEFRESLETGEFANSCYGEDSWLTLGPLKLFKDGSLGARTARLKHGYVSDRENHGLEWLTTEEMDEYCGLAKAHNLQVVTHAIGDAAVEDAINCYERAFVDGKNKLRHGLIHCQITDSKLLDRIAKNDILVFAQPIFLNYDIDIVEALCGKELASTSYAFKTLARRGAHISYGTDCPVEDCNPFPNIYAAVTRKNLKGHPSKGFYAKECVSVEDALDAYTIESAFAEFMEHKKGRIKSGYYADMVLLDQDIFTIDPMEIKDIRPVMTMVGGNIVYSAEA